MEYIEVSARTVDDAITEALIKLGATSDQIEYEVIEKGSTGFLGIARKDAVIKVRKKYSVEGDITEFLQKIFAAMDLKVVKYLLSDHFIEPAGRNAVLQGLPAPTHWSTQKIPHCERNCNWYPA